MRLIDADALIDNLELMYEHRDSKDEPYNIGVRGAINMTRKAPTIEPKRGEWIDAEIRHEDGVLPIQVCSECKTFYPLEYTGGGHRFCPNCGAKMKGADDE